MQNHPIDDPVEKVSAKVYVQTPEQIEFAFDVAGVGPRILAYLLDLLIRAGIMTVIAIALTIFFGGQMFSIGIMAVVAFVLEWGYHTILEWAFNGVTPGKKALGLRVVRTDGVSLDLYRSAMRNFLRAADGFPSLWAVPTYAIGILTIFVTGTGRRLGDLAADTMVVKEEIARLRELPPLPKGVVPLSAQDLVTARLRSRDLAMIDEFFRRRHLFSHERAEEIADVLAAPISKRLGISVDSSEKLIGGILASAHEERTSYTGRESAFSIITDPMNGGRR